MGAGAIVKNLASVLRSRSTAKAFARVGTNAKAEMQNLQALESRLGIAQSRLAKAEQAQRQADEFLPTLNSITTRGSGNLFEAVPASVRRMVRSGDRESIDLVSSRLSDHFKGQSIPGIGKIESMSVRPISGAPSMRSNKLPATVTVRTPSGKIRTLEAEFNATGNKLFVSPRAPSRAINPRTKELIKTDKAGIVSLRTPMDLVDDLKSVPASGKIGADEVAQGADKIENVVRSRRLRVQDLQEAVDERSAFIRDVTAGRKPRKKSPQAGERGSDLEGPPAPPTSPTGGGPLSDGLPDPEDLTPEGLAKKAKEEKSSKIRKGLISAAGGLGGFAAVNIGLGALEERQQNLGSGNRLYDMIGNAQDQRLQMLRTMAAMQRMQFGARQNLANLAVQQPHIFNEMVAGRQLAPGVVSVGGNRMAQMQRMTEVGAAMAGGDFNQMATPNSIELLQQYLGAE